MNRLHSCCTRGGDEGVDAWISSPFSELKLPALSSWGISDGEKKYFDQGTAILHGRQDGGAQEITPFCALVGFPGAPELTPWLPGVGIPFPGGFFLWSLL